jgi:hypothetical protein
MDPTAELWPLRIGTAGGLWVPVKNEGWVCVLSCRADALLRFGRGDAPGDRGVSQHTPCLRAPDG